jgi:hypothetical protein
VQLGRPAGLPSGREGRGRTSLSSASLASEASWPPIHPLSTSGRRHPPRAAAITPLPGPPGDGAAGPLAACGCGDPTGDPPAGGRIGWPGWPDSDERYASTRHLNLLHGDATRTLPAFFGFFAFTREWSDFMRRLFLTAPVTPSSTAHLRKRLYFQPVRLP